MKRTTATTWLHWLAGPIGALLLLSGCGGGSGGGSSSGGTSSSSSSGGSSSSSSGAVALCPNLPLADSVIGQAGFTSGAGNPGGVTGAGLGGAQGAAASAGTTFFVPDGANNRILGYSSAPTGSGASAGFVLGQPDVTSTASGLGPQGAEPFGLRVPVKAWVDPAGGYLAVADSGNNRVLIWHPLPTSNAAPSLVIGQPDLNSGAANQPAGTPSASNLSNPSAAVVANGKLIVADTGNNRVLIWNSIPTSSGQAADLVSGQTDFNSTSPNLDQFSNSTNTFSLHMNAPFDTWSDGIRLLVTDTGNHRVLYWSAIPTKQNQSPSSLLGFAKLGEESNGSAGASGFNAPHGVASDGTNVFVADTNNNRVMLFDNYLATAGTSLLANAVFGQTDFNHIAADDPDQNGASGDQSVSPTTNGVTAATLSSPAGLLALSSGQFWVTDSGNARLLRFQTASGVNGSEPRVPCTN